MFLSKYNVPLNTIFKVKSVKVGHISPAPCLEQERETGVSYFDAVSLNNRLYIKFYKHAKIHADPYTTKVTLNISLFLVTTQNIQPA